MKTKLLAFLAIASLLSITGCASVNVSDSYLLDKAEMATGIQQSNLTLVQNSKEASGSTLNFKVQDKENNIYRCYYEKILFLKSDAICTKLGETQSSSSNTNCNDLLKAAGKC